MPDTPTNPLPAAIDQEAVELIIHARWIAPVIPRQTIFENCALVIDDGTIIALLPAAEADRRYRARTTHHLLEHLVFPGLINSHTHAAMSLLRGFADDYPLQTWLHEHIWPAENHWVSAEFVKDGTELAMAEMIRGGTTTFADMYFFPEDAARAVHEAGMRAQITFPVFDFPCAWGQGPDDYIRKGLALHDAYRSNELITIGFGPHAPYTVSDEPLQRIATLAEELQAPIQIHVHETATEVSDALASSGKRPLQRLQEIGLLSPLTQCVHMTQIDDSDIAILQQTGAHVIHCPESNLKLASGFCPAAKLLDADINVAIGTDGAASNNDLDMLGEMRTAALLGKGVSGDPTKLDAFTTLEMATLNAAKALGIDSRTGSLEVGKAADISAVRMTELESLPLFKPLSQLIYTQSGSRVSHVWVNGRCLLAERKLQTLSEHEITTKARRWQEKIASH